jgi:acyl-CoA thioester hydrolase
MANRESRTFGKALRKRGDRFTTHDLRSTGAGGRLKAAEDAVFSWPVRVYYEDTDAGGVVYYANHLRFLERARTEWLRALGYGQTALAATHRVVFVVRSVAVDYHGPARLDDALEVTVEPAEFGASRVALAQRVLREGEMLVSAHIRLACVDVGTFRPVRIPKSVAERLTRHAPDTKGSGT